MKHIKIIGAIALIAFSLTACQTSETELPESGSLTTGPTESTTINTVESTSEPEPFIIEDFTLTRLDGTTTTLYEYEGQNQLILLNFWATWCKFCVEEMPLLDALDERDDVTVLAVSVGEEADLVKEYIDTNGYSFNVFLDQDAKLAGTFGVAGFPTTVFIGPDFEYYYVFPGMLEENMLQSILDAIDEILVKRGHK